MFLSLYNLLFPKSKVISKKPAPEKPSVIKNVIDYVINDSSTPNLVEKVKIPAVGNLRYSVRDYNPNPKNLNQRRALNCFITIGNCINYTQINSKSIIKRWSSTQNLDVIPLAGLDVNAYYDRRSLKFFYSKVNNTTIYTANSQDIVAHELGHAILDAMRPDFWSVQSLEIWSFHEAFADICAIVSIMQYEEALKKVLEDTNGDISKSNLISRLAEEVGVFIYNNYSDKYLPNALRDPAIEVFKYVDPQTLPTETSNDKLAAECHSFGRVFTAAWYNIFVKVYEKECLTSSQIVAIKKARDICFSLLLQSIPTSPRVANYYSAIAKSMISLSKIKFSQYESLIKESFIEFNILSKEEQLKVLSNTSWQEIVANLNKNDEVIKNSKGIIVKLSRNKTIKIQNLSILSTNGNDSYVEVEAPSDIYFEFDNNGILIDEIVPDEKQILESSLFCLSIIEKQDKNNMWSIENNKLVRNYIV